MAEFVFQNGCSYISAVNLDMSTKFGLLIDFDFSNTVASTSRKPEVVFSGRAAILRNRYDVIFLQYVVSFG